MNKIEGIVFDWAGTTVDFGCFAPVQAFVQSFQAAGIDATMAEARAPMGLLKRDHIRAMLAMPRIKQLWESKHGRAADAHDVETIYACFEPLLLASLKMYTDPLPEVVQTVQLLRDAGLKIGSTTGYTDSMLEIVAAAARPKGYAPDFWITPDSTEAYGRPYPYMIFRNIEALRLKAPHTVIKVGDTVADIQEGTNAAVWSVGVAIGSSQMGLGLGEYQLLSEAEKQKAVLAAESAFLSAGADFTIASMKELPDLVETINDLLQQGKKPGVK